MASASGYSKKDFQVQFDKESERWFKYLQRGTKPLVVKTLAQGVKAIAAILERRGKTESPIYTGRLRNSIRYELFNNATSARVWPNVDYAIFVHEGTPFIKANPFFDRALDYSQSDIRSITDQLGTKIAVGITRG